MRADRFLGRTGAAGPVPFVGDDRSSGSFWMTRVFIAAPLGCGTSSVSVALDARKAGDLPLEGPVYWRLQDRR
jgi:hypothetical protein